MPTINEVIANNVDDGYADYEDYYSSGASCNSVNSSNTLIRFYARSDYNDQDQHWNTWRPYLRFETIDIPQGATITAAKIQLAFHSKINGSGQSITIRGEDTDDASSAASSCSSFGGATRTSANVSWAFASSMSAGTFYDTADISSIVQEIVNRAGWSANNDMQFFFEDHTYVSSTNWLFDFRSKNYSGSTYTPKLVITYTLGVDITGVIAGLNTAAIMGTVEYGSLSVTPTLAGGDTAAIMGTAVLGSQSVTPALAGADTSAIAGTAILASFSVTPSSANVATAAIGPIFNEVTPADPANADTAAIMGTVVYGSLSTTATLAGADTAAVMGTVVYTSFPATASAATANVNAESVTSLLSSFSLTPTLAGGKTAAIAPYVLIVYPSISHSLYVGGVSTYSSNQVMALDNGNIIYKTGDSVFNKTIDTAAKAATTFYRATTYFTAGDIEQKIIVQDGGSVVVKNLP